MVNMESFFNEIGRFMNVSAESRAALTAIMETKMFHRGDSVLKPNSVCNYFHFVESGLLRTYYLKDGKDVTDWLSPENSFSCSIVSFISRQPDRRGIEALEDTLVWSIAHDKLEALYQEYHEIERLGRMLYGSGVIQVQQRFDDLHFSSALDRYTKLMQMNPTLIQRTPLGMIASYLGITQPTLSRIRAQYHS